MFGNSYMKCLMLTTAAVRLGVGMGAVMADETRSPTADRRHAAHQVVCLGTPIPSGTVVVGYLRSPRCSNTRGSSNSNAVEVALAEAGIAACELPDYLKADGEVIRFATCRKVLVDACPARLDGGPNAYQLSRLEQCVDERTHAGCEDDRDPIRSGSIIVEERNQPACGPPAPILYPGISFGSVPYSWTKRREMRPGDLFPVCVALLPDGVIAAYARQRDFPILVVREFFDSACPDRRRDAAQIANAYVVTMIDRSSFRGEQFVCAISAMSIDPTLIRKHDDRCGTDGVWNSAMLTFP